MEKQAAAGEHAGRRAVRAHEACHTAVRVSAARCAGRLGNRYWRHDSECKGRQQECPNNGHHCIACHLRWLCWFARATAWLIQRCTLYMAASPRNGPGTCFKTQSYKIQDNPCNHCGGHAFVMARGAVALAKKAATAARGAAAAAASAAPKRKAAADSSSGSDGSDELVDNRSENSAEQGSDDQTTATDNSRKVKTKKPRKSAVIPRCDFIFVLLSKPKS